MAKGLTHATSALCEDPTLLQPLGAATTTPGVLFAETS